MRKLIPRLSPQMFGAFDHGRSPKSSLIVDARGNISALAVFWAGNVTDSCSCGASASPEGALMLDGWSIDQGVFSLGAAVEKNTK
jgi:hypothetical protein